MALVGLGGVGKSQLAIEFTHRLSEKRKDIWIFWIHAGTRARAEEGFRTIADTVKLAGRNQPTADIPQLVSNWLSNTANGRWVLVLDSVDDGDVFFGIQGERKDARLLATWLPQSRNGSIVITTRDQGVAVRLTGRHQDTIPIRPMVEIDAVSLLEKRLGQLPDRRMAADLVQALDRVPLAISQAAAYIQERGQQTSISTYLADFQASEYRKNKLLAHDGRDLRRDGGASNAILVTWQMSFDHIHETRPSAADLLSLMSFFDRQGIPERLLRYGEREDNRLGKALETSAQSWLGRPKLLLTRFMGHLQEGRSKMEADNDRDQSLQWIQREEFEKDIVTLRNFSFVSDTRGAGFEMHGLVQLATRKWLEANGLLETWKQQFISKLCAEVPTGEYENWATWQELFPHAKSAVEQRPKAQGSVLEWASILYKAAWYALRMGNGVDTQLLGMKAKEAREKILGEEHKDSISSVAMVALGYKLQGRWSEAEKLQVQVMERSKAKLGADHPDTLISMAHLASTYWNQGRWEEAEKLGVQVMETSKTKLGADHPDTLTGMGNLASTYWDQGRWEEAEKLFVQVMETSKTKLGADHPDTLTSMANLASTYSKQGRWSEAEKLFVQVMERSKTKLGADHPDTLTSMVNLASTYSKQGRWSEAEKLEVQVMESRKTKPGADHPDTLISMASLVSTYWNQGRWEEAEKLGLQVMESRKIKLGADHPDTLTSMANLASTFWSQGRWEEAEKLQAQVMKMSKTKLGADHPDTLTSMSNLAFIWEPQGRHSDAIRLMEDCALARQRVLGPAHPGTLLSLAAIERWSEPD